MSVINFDVQDLIGRYFLFYFDVPVNNYEVHNQLFKQAHILLLLHDSILFEESV